MAGKYWIKLYHEILDDPKMGRLSDRAYRRCIEIFLLAGETGNDGILPATDDIAWRLRIDQDELETDLEELAAVNIVEQLPDGTWLVRKFSERQDPMTKAEYMRRKRGERQTQQYYGNDNCYQPVTNGNADSEAEAEEESDAKVTPAATPASASNGRYITASEAERIYQDVTGQATFPSSIREHATESICALAHQYGEATLDYLRPFWDAWTARRRKDGRLYSRASPGWLDWAVAGEIPGAPPGNGNIPTEEF